MSVKHEIAGIGICVAALISADQGTIVGAPNIANLSELNFVAEIKKVFKVRCHQLPKPLTSLLEINALLVGPIWTNQTEIVKFELLKL